MVIAAELLEPLLIRKFLGQSSTQENMDKNGEEIVDFAAREATQEEAAAWAAAEVALRADETVDGNGGRKFNLNRPLVEYKF